MNKTPILIIGFVFALILSFLGVLHAQVETLQNPTEDFHSVYFDHPLIVKKGVFMPRIAETSFLPFMHDHAALFKGKNILEIGTGSGIMSLYAIKLGARKVVATDINADALNNTILNAQRFGYSDRLETRRVWPSNPGAFAPMKANERFDVIITDPPYTFDLIPHKSKNTGDDGTLALSIATGLKGHLTAGGYAILLYNDYFSQKFMLRLLQLNGLPTRAHDSNQLTRHQLKSMMRFFNKELVNHLHLDPKKMKQTYHLPSTYTLPPDALSHPPLVDGDKADKIYSGMIVVHLPVQRNH